MFLLAVVDPFGLWSPFDSEAEQTCRGLLYR